MAISLKKPKKPQAPVRAPAGGVMAPKSAAKGPGLSRARNLNPTSGKTQNVNLSKTTQTSGNSGTGSGGPAAPPPGIGAPPPESPVTHNARLDATNSFRRQQQQGAYNRMLAAMKYGDLTAANAYGKEYSDLTGTAWTPLTSLDEGELAQIDKAEKANQFQNKIGHVENNTYRSGLNLRDIQTIADKATFDKGEAKRNYDTAVHEYYVAQEEAKEAYEIAIREADEEDLINASKEGGGSEDGGDGGGGGTQSPSSGYTGTGYARAFNPPKNQNQNFKRNDDLSNKKKKKN